MRKAIMLEVRVLIEGEDEAAHDFAASAQQALGEIIASGSALHPSLKVKVKKLRVVEE